MNDYDASRSNELSHDPNLSDKNFKQAETNNFKPVYIIGEWEDHREEQRVTVTILMPNGSFES